MMMKKQIPNIITCLNVFCGTLAVFMAIWGQITVASALILTGMLFDFLDGMTARILRVKSDIGKELDSLADVVSFGVAPAILACHLLLETLPGNSVFSWAEWTLHMKVLLVCPLMIPAFSALRLAKFNLDPRQTTTFIGMPTPANALFWVGLVLGSRCCPDIYDVFFAGEWVLGISALILSILLVSELPMFSLKISSLGWNSNKGLYLLGAVSICLTFFLGKAIVMFVIPCYILVNAIMALQKAVTDRNQQADRSQHNPPLEI